MARRGFHGHILFRLLHRRFHFHQRRAIFLQQRPTHAHHRATRQQRRKPPPRRSLLHQLPKRNVPIHQAAMKHQLLQQMQQMGEANPHQARQQPRKQQRHAQAQRKIARFHRIILFTVYQKTAAILTQINTKAA